MQFIHPGQTLKNMCSPALTIRNIIGGQGGADAYKELRKNLQEYVYYSSWKGYEMQQVLWRLQDLRDGGGLGFAVELFFLALSQLLSTSSSTESHSTLYTSTFRAIISGWREHKDSLGTQQVLLNIAISHRWQFEACYPAYIVDEFFSLLGNVFEGQAGQRIDDANRYLQFFRYQDGRLTQGILSVLRQAQAPSPPS